MCLLGGVNQRQYVAFRPVVGQDTRGPGREVPPVRMVALSFLKPEGMIRP